MNQGGIDDVSKYYATLEHQKALKYFLAWIDCGYRHIVRDAARLAGRDGEHYEALVREWERGGLIPPNDLQVGSSPYGDLLIKRLAGVVKGVRSPSPEIKMDSLVLGSHIVQNMTSSRMTERISRQASMIRKAAREFFLEGNRLDDQRRAATAIGRLIEALPAAEQHDALVESALVLMDVIKKGDSENAKKARKVYAVLVPALPESFKGLLLATPPISFGRVIPFPVHRSLIGR
jgi:hypothetical protein